MFIHPLTSTNKLFRISILPYAENHFIKRFAKSYRGKQWELTKQSIIFDLERIAIPTSPLQKSSQIDELSWQTEKWLFKYDFKIAGSRSSTKSSGNRAVGILDQKLSTISLFLIYGKTDLPKNTSETSYIFSAQKSLALDFQP